MTKTQNTMDPMSPTPGELIRYNLILAFYLLAYTHLCSFLPKDASLLGFVWMVVGGVVVTLHVARTCKKHPAKVINTMTEGAKFLVMAMLWPLVLFRPH
jgi:hypothetical protein